MMIMVFSFSLIFRIVEIIAKIGHYVSQSSVSNVMWILHLPPPFQSLYRDKDKNTMKDFRQAEKESEREHIFITFAICEREHSIPYFFSPTITK
jgi:hypothetical protein